MHVALPTEGGIVRDRQMSTEVTKLTTRERAQVDVTKPTEVVAWCNKWGVTPERLRAAVAEVGTSAPAVAKALGRPT
jgi:hypothetical protein